MKKRYIGILMSLILMLLVAVGVSAVGTFEEPDASETITGTFIVNVSSAKAQGIENCTITITSATSESSVVTLILLNDTTIADGTNNYANITWDSTAVADASDYVFAGTCQNDTGQVAPAITSRTGIILDNTVPVLTLVSPADLSVDKDGSVVFSYTCAGATSATLNLDGTTYTMTESSDTCSLTQTVIGNSKHSWFITASDGKDSTISSTLIVEIRKPGGSGLAEGATIISPDAKTGVSGNNLFPFLFFGGLIWFFIGRKKKK